MKNGMSSAVLLPKLKGGALRAVGKAVAKRDYGKAMKLTQSVIDNEKTRFDKKPLAEYLRQQGATSAADLIKLFETVLFAVPIPADAKDRITDLYKNGGGSSEDRIKESVHALCTLPEFQLA